MLGGIDGNPMRKGREREKKFVRLHETDLRVATGDERPYARACELGWLCYWNCLFDVIARPPLVPQLWIPIIQKPYVSECGKSHSSTFIG